MASRLHAFFGTTQELAKADYKASSGTKAVILWQCKGNWSVWILSYDARMFLHVLNKNCDCSCSNKRSLGRGPNSKPPKYKAALLYTRPWRSVWCLLFCEKHSHTQKLHLFLHKKKKSAAFNRNVHILCWPRFFIMTILHTRITPKILPLICPPQAITSKKLYLITDYIAYRSGQVSSRTVTISRTSAVGRCPAISFRNENNHIYLSF